MTPLAEPLDLKLLDNLSVLYVEDEADTRAAMTRYLARQGLKVIDAEDGASGLELFRQQRPQFVVADIRMPNMDGIAMCREIRAIDAMVPIVLLTAHDEPKLLRDSIGIGVVDYLLKPVDRNALLATLARIARKLHLTAREKNEKDYDLGKIKGYLSRRFPDQFRKLARLGFSIYRVALGLNDLLREQGQTGHFVAATLIRIDERAHLLEVLNCGNPPARLVNQQGEHVREFTSRSTPLGLLPSEAFDAEIETCEIEMPARLYVYTDGLVDSLDQPGLRFDDDALRDLLAQAPAGAAYAAVNQRVEQIADTPRVDDITFIEVTLDKQPEAANPQNPSTGQGDAAQAYSPPAMLNKISDKLKGARVLLVEDEAEAREALARYLQRRVGMLYTARDGAEGLQKFETYRPELVITDARMPNMDGLTMVQGIRALDPDVPVILISAAASLSSNTRTVQQMLDLKVDKYLPKPLDSKVLLETVAESLRDHNVLRNTQLTSSVFMTSPLAIIIADRERLIEAVNPAFSRITGYTEAEVMGCNPNVLSSGKHNIKFFKEMWDALNARGVWSGEVWNRRKNGDLYLEWVTINAIRDEAGEILNYVAVFADITERNAAEKRMHYLAHHDALTDLPNRVLLMDRLRQALLQAERNEELVALLFIDLDNFKSINDSKGHDVGDDLLCSIAKTLSQSVREADTVSRFGGDEFAVLLPNVGSREMVEKLTVKLIKAVNSMRVVKDMKLEIGASIGISIYPFDGETPEALIKHADSAMYLAKQSGKNNYYFFVESLAQKAERHLAIQQGLRDGLRDGEFFLEYQPKFSCASGKVMGAEALVRWRHPTLGLVRPDEFIPIAEETGLIVDLEVWVITTVCHHLASWRAGGIPLTRIAVNISPLHFRRGNVIQTVRNALEAHDLSPNWLQVELTESMVMEHTPATITHLNELRTLGITIAVDDFGTGYSCLSYLCRLPIDEIKIDKAFVREISEQVQQDNAAATAVPLAIIQLAKSLGLSLVAEGVETEAQKAFMVSNGCDVIQGYIYSQPLEVKVFADLLHQHGQLT